LEMSLLDSALDEFGDAALLVVAPRIANEQVVRHDSIEWSRNCVAPFGELVQLREHVPFQGVALRT